jgi:hypothetical protein
MTVKELVVALTALDPKKTVMICGDAQELYHIKPPVDFVREVGVVVITPEYNNPRQA